MIKKTYFYYISFCYIYFCYISFHWAKRCKLFCKALPLRCLNGDLATPLHHPTPHHHSQIGLSPFSKRIHEIRTSLMNFKNMFPLFFSTEVKLPFETFMFSVNLSRNFFVNKCSTSGLKSWRRWTDFRNEFVYANLTRKSFAQSNFSSFHFSLFVQ